MSKSLSVRVLLGSSLVTCAILVLAGIVLLLLLHSGLSKEFDRRLLNTAQNLTTTIEQVNGEIIFEWEGTGSGPISIFRVYDLNGKSIAQSNNGPSIEHSKTDKPVKDSHEFFSSELSDQSRSRVVRLSFVPFQENDDDYNKLIEQKQIQPSNDIVILEVAFPTEDMESTMRLAKWLWVAVTLATAIVAPLLLWPIILAALQPVKNIATQIANLDERKLSYAFNTDRCPQELLPITTRLEELLKRLQQAFSREKQITDNLAHELKTPLAGLSATLELAASKPRTPEAYQQTIQKCRSIVSHLITLSERILQLARLEAGQVNAIIEEINLAQLIGELQNDLGMLYPDGDLRIQTDFASLPSIHTDRTLLKQILTNLSQNAIEHGVGNTPILIRSCASPLKTILISNACTDMDADSLVKLKDRFFQLDSSRSKTGFHSGLGLAICDQIAKSLNASLHLHITQDGRFVSTIQFEN